MTGEAAARDQIAARLIQLRTWLLARDGKPGYKVNCAHLRAEISRLEAQYGEADGSGSEGAAEDAVRDPVESAG